MTDADRLAHNRLMIGQCFPPFGRAVGRIQAQMQAWSYRPRIQCAWRSPKDQQTSFKTHHSEVSWSYHQAMALGKPDALAVDMIDDDNPLVTPLQFCIDLARAARGQNVQTGILWDLNEAEKLKLNLIIGGRGELLKDTDVRVGFDPCHIEPAQFTLAQAFAGERPTYGMA